ncbi:hypothetical protein RWV98_00040 [Agathobaculum sp. NTUH-O15-33]|uniref:hypothetical protein n=1 Tax=Agathobaculum sp. NTUH-O15-33 TaxID=3079302 RepID=UPI0029587FC5|nr:hypothetical protein [Agathobaculum sp. NTUH-O15-33]WNX84702.1 hypothetical protein RWV98_00040 [Agathobaculum sp. NTUH-O15-33]
MAERSTTDRFWNGRFSLGTFDAIVLMDGQSLSTGGLGAFFHAAFRFPAEQRMYLCCWI